MSDTLHLDVQVREKVGGPAAHKARKSGQIPAVIYGHGTDVTHVTVDGSSFRKIYSQVGESSLFDVAINGAEPTKVLIQEVQRDANTLDPIHVDFYQVNMNEPLKAHIPIEFVGESPAVKNHGAVLVTVFNQVEVQCLPADLPSKFVVDLSKLSELDDRMKISDIEAPSGVTILADASDTVVLAEAPRSEEEIAALDEAVQEDVAAVEGAAEEKPEGEEAEAAAADAESGDAPAEDADKPQSKE